MCSSLLSNQLNFLNKFWTTIRYYIIILKALMFTELNTETPCLLLLSLNSGSIEKIKGGGGGGRVVERKRFGMLLHSYVSKRRVGYVVGV